MKTFVLPIITDENRLPFYVYCIGGMENQVPIDRPDGYPYYIWLHCVRGSGKLVLEQMEYVLRPNMGLLIFPGVAHKYQALDQPWETHWVAFQGYAVKPLLDALDLRRSGIFPLNNLPLLDRLLNDIFVAARSNSPNRGLQTSAKLYAFLGELKHCLGSDRSRDRAAAQHRLEPVLALMEKQYGNDLTLERMAEAIGTSPQYLCRIFKRVFQVSPFAYLTKLRLQKAKELLIEQPGLSVSETAKQVGFHDASYFCALFRRHEGVTPLEFKKFHR